MKKSFYLFVLCTCLVPVISMAAVTKCVNLSSGTTCKAISVSVYGNNVEWRGLCNSINVRGVSKCSSTANTTWYHKVGFINTTSATANNKYCYCKLISPAVSSWVVIGFCTSSSCVMPGGGTASECEQYCAKSCQDELINKDNFRSAIFSGLSD